MVGGLYGGDRMGTTSETRIYKRVRFSQVGALFGEIKQIKRSFLAENVPGFGDCIRAVLPNGSACKVRVTNLAVDPPKNVARILVQKFDLIVSLRQFVKSGQKNEEVKKSEVDKDWNDLYVVEIEIPLDLTTIENVECLVEAVAEKKPNRTRQSGGGTLVAECPRRKMGTLKLYPMISSSIEKALGLGEEVKPIMFHPNLIQSDS